MSWMSYHHAGIQVLTHFLSMICFVVFKYFLPYFAALNMGIRRKPLGEEEGGERQNRRGAVGMNIAGHYVSCPRTIRIVLIQI